jgi:uncharacterized protein (DUF2141 family)
MYLINKGTIFATKHIQTNDKQMIWQTARKIWYKLIIILICFLFFNVETFGQTATLEVEIRGIGNKEGKIWVALYRTPENFLTKKFHKGIQENVSVGTTTIKFKDLEAGNYAISCFHDVNNNGQLDTNMFGIPAEPYGFSNNPRLLFSAPKFDNSKFTHKVEGSKITITLR